MLREIELDDKDRVEGLRRRFGHELSSHAFASLFLWKDKMKLSIDLEEDGFLIQTEEENMHEYFYPCGSEDAQLRFLQMHMEEPGFSLVYVREEDRSFLETHFPGQFSYEEAPDSDEYLFFREDFKSLDGYAYANVRKRINRLKRKHELEVSLFCDEDEETAHALLTKWEEAVSHQPGIHGLLDDGIPERALRYRKELEFYGLTVRVDGEVKGFAFGFLLDEHTIDGCSECHDLEIEGLSFYIQMAMLLYAPEGVQYMNGEEDLGISGLRTMKRFLNPCRMNRVVTARRLEG